MLNEQSKIFKYPDGKLALQASFHTLATDMRLSGNAALEKVSNKIDAITKNIIDDFWNTGFVLLRIELTTNNARTNSKMVEFWRMSTSNDVDYMHILIRSMLDNIAELVKFSSPKPGTLPPSFNKLYTGINRYSKSLDNEIIAIIKRNEWFVSAKEIRDEIVHRNGRTFVFGTPDQELTFQTYSNKFNKMINNKEQAANENIIYFEKYASKIIANLIKLLEDITNRLYSLYDVKRLSVSYLRSPGLDIIKRFIDSDTTPL